MIVGAEDRVAEASIAAVHFAPNVAEILADQMAISRAAGAIFGKHKGVQVVFDGLGKIFLQLGKLSEMLSGQRVGANRVTCSEILDCLGNLFLFFLNFPAKNIEREKHIVLL